MRLSVQKESLIDRKKLTQLFLKNGLHIYDFNEDGMNIYGISYAQFLNDNHCYDIQDNTIETEGMYTIYLLKVTGNKKE